MTRSIEWVWDHLDEYRSTPRARGYPDNVVRLWAPIDRVHAAIADCCDAARVSLASSMFGWDDAEINDIFLAKLQDESVPVQLSLDSTQAAGPGEVPLISQWHGIPGNSLAIGHSGRGDINHLKSFVIDGVLSIGGSTNLSEGGQSKQNNEAIFVWDAVYAAETSARLAVIHDEMLGQMAKKRTKVLVDWAAKKTKLSLDERHKLEAGLLP